MNMYSLFKEWDECHSIQVKGGKKWKEYETKEYLELWLKEKEND